MYNALVDRQQLMLVKTDATKPVDNRALHAKKYVERLTTTV